MEAFDTIGEWWLPTAPEHRVSGKLRCDESGDLRLSVLGNLTGTHSWGRAQTRSIVLGTVADNPFGRTVTLADCFVSSWTTSFDGQIVEYSSTLGTATTIQNAGGTLQGARGMMIVNNTVYVTVQGYGAGFVYDFSTSATTAATSPPALK